MMTIGNSNGRDFREPIGKSSLSLFHVLQNSQRIRQFSRVYNLVSKLEIDIQQMLFKLQILQTHFPAGRFSDEVRTSKLEFQS